MAGIPGMDNMLLAQLMKDMQVRYDTQLIGATHRSLYALSHSLSLTRYLFFFFMTLYILYTTLYILYTTTTYINNNILLIGS
jgi:hypothetical protein